MLWFSTTAAKPYTSAKHWRQFAPLPGAFF
jgi:hypothetical protein